MDDSVHFGSDGDVAIILVNRLQKPVIKAIDYALAARHDTPLAVPVAVDEADADRLQKEWEEPHLPVPLVIIESPYRTRSEERRVGNEWVSTCRTRVSPDP